MDVLLRGSSELTAAEYAVWCAERTAQEPDVQESDLTWGQTAKYLAEVIDAYGDMSEPEELKAFHDAVIAFLKASHEFVWMQDASEPFDNAASFSNDEINAQADALSDVAGTLDEETFLQLVDVGCIFS